MPTFDFRCSACGSVFEHTRPFGSEENPPCPTCDSRAVEKLIAPPAIQFRGTGFYKTDSLTKPPGKQEGRPQEPKKEEKIETPKPPAEDLKKA